MTSAGTNNTATAKKSKVNPSKKKKKQQQEKKPLSQGRKQRRATGSAVSGLAKHWTLATGEAAKEVANIVSAAAKALADGQKAADDVDDADDSTEGKEEENNNKKKKKKKKKKKTTPASLFIVGINAVTRALEKKAVRAVVVFDDLRPSCLLRHVTEHAAREGLPLLVLGSPIAAATIKSALAVKRLAAFAVPKAPASSPSPPPPGASSSSCGDAQTLLLEDLTAALYKSQSQPTQRRRDTLNRRDTFKVRRRKPPSN